MECAFARTKRQKEYLPVNIFAKSKKMHIFATSFYGQIQKLRSSLFRTEKRKA